MDDGVLPDDGEGWICSVPLPAGRRHRSEDGEQLVAWVTEGPVTDPGGLWSALSEARPDSGLVPVLLTAGSPPDGQPADELPSFGFCRPAEVSRMDRMSAEQLLADNWAHARFDDLAATSRAPFGATFPGLAPAESERLTMAQLANAVAALPPAYLGLVVAVQPADVPAIVGWSVFGSDTPGGPDARALKVSAVLRSWEARFGARLLSLGPGAEFRVMIERPPRTLETAQSVAAEHLAFADECGGRSGWSVRELAGRLIAEPLWQFRWN